MKKTTETGTIDQGEVEKFSKIAQEWWNSSGKFKPLHKINPIRLAYIKEKICKVFKRDSNAEKPLEGLSILDIGCGGGLLCEPLARLGATVVGIDVSNLNIKIAQVHAKKSNLKIDYYETSIEDFVLENRKFDVVLAMEVVEHVVNVSLFLKLSCHSLKSTGIIFVATLNRTLKSLMFAIIGAEYILRWLPKGTHDYQKFIKPEEISVELKQNKLNVGEAVGIVYNPIRDGWKLSKDTDVNYLMYGLKSRQSSAELD